MLDDLRNSATSQPFEEDLPPEQPEVRRSIRRSGGPFLGMTAKQRFVIALLLFLMVLVLGTFCLVVTQKIVF
jgi:hypothetical protein